MTLATDKRFNAIIVTRYNMDTCKGSYGISMEDIHNLDKKELSQCFEETSQIRLLLYATLAILECIPDGESVKIHCSDYLFISSFINKSYRVSDNDLWTEIQSQQRNKCVQFVYLYNARNNCMYQIAFRLATEAMFYPFPKIDHIKEPSSVENDNSHAVNVDTPKPSSAMVISIDVPKQVSMYYDENKVVNTESCRNAISNLPEAPSFNDLMNIRSGKIDAWSRLSNIDLQERFDTQTVDFVKTFLSSEKDIASCLRWYGRGMRIDHSIRKLLIQQEIVQRRSSKKNKELSKL